MTALALPRDADLDQLEAAAEAVVLKHDLQAFARAAWPVVEPGAPLVWNWHLEAVLEHLQAVTEGEIKRLIINIPPRMTKSLATCVLWPAWEWTRAPHIKWLFASHEQTLATRDSVTMRRLLESPWYQARFPHVKLRHDQNQKTRYENTAGGYRIAKSFGGSVTGEGGNRRVVDDPHSARDVHSDVQREGELEWWKTSWSTRTINPATDTEVIIMQRLHERDLTGYLLEEVGGYEHLMLPMRFDPERRCTTAIGFTDPRTEQGELLNPQRFPAETVDDLAVRLGSYGEAGQLQQDPKPAGGGIFKEWWWRYWQPEGANLGPVRVKDADGQIIEIHPVTLPDPDLAEHFIQSWDMAFKDTKEGSHVCGQAWMQTGADAFLIDQVLDRLDFPATIAAVRSFTSTHPKYYAKLVEDKANGPAVISSLRSELGGFIESKPHGSKEARAHAVSARVEAGNVYLPHPRLYAWLERTRTALSTFPSTHLTDPVDALTQALDYLPTGGESYGKSRTKAKSARGGGRR